MLTYNEKYQETALTCACMKKHYDIIKYLIKKGARVNHVDNVSWIPKKISLVVVIQERSKLR